MSTTETRKVGERGQVTIPKEFREKEHIHGGDIVNIRDEDGKIIIEKETREEELKEAYQRMADRDKQVNEEWESASREANKHL